MGERHEEVVPHHIYIYISIITIISTKDPFFCAIMKFPCYHNTVIILLNVLIDFLTIIKYRKKDINKILNCWLLLFNSQRYPSNCWISFCRYAISFPLSSQAVYNWDMIIRKYEVRLLISSNSCFNTSFLLSMTSSCLSALHTPSGSLILYAAILAMLTNHCILSVVTPSILSSLCSFRRRERLRFNS